MPLLEHPKTDCLRSRVDSHQSRMALTPLASREIESTPSDWGQSNESLRAGVSVARRLRAKWFWYSLLSLLCWTAWALTAKVGSSKLPVSAMQFVSAIGFLLVSVLVAKMGKKRNSQTNYKGRVYSVISGLLLGIGGLASFGAYRAGTNTAATTGITSLYPAITVVCALLVLKERLSKSQVLGVGLSAVAVLLFSI